MGMFSNRSIIGILAYCCSISGRASIHAFAPHRLNVVQTIPRGGASSKVFSSSSVVEESVETSAYEKLVEKLEAVTQLSRASAVLGYDQMVFMPASAAAQRAGQMAALATVIHEKKTNPEILELIESALKEETSADNLRLLEIELKAFLENERVPAELAAKSAALGASAYQDWIAAKEAQDYDKFAPTLQECFTTAMEIAEKKGDLANQPDKLYDQMLDEFESGMSKERIDDIFSSVQEKLVSLIQKVCNSSTPPSTDPIKGSFDIEQQKLLSQKLVSAIGFNSENGRIDVSVHPFTSSMSSDDVRITSRFREDEWYQGLAGSIHEGGHAIYEQNLRSSALSIDSAFTMGTHESQSLFWERHVGLSKSFWKFATPLLQEIFPSYDYTAEEVYGAVNAVSKSLIRVEADELTYPLHVILRYNIEKDVISGNLEVKDISKRWNQDMKELLDIDVPSDDKGCLQDVHWSALAFGYFPTYLIGAITAAQLFHYCSKDIPDIDEKMEQGQFDEIKEWLTDKVHQHGKRYKSLDALLQDQVGEELNPEYFINYLTEKYSDLYQL